MYPDLPVLWHYGYYQVRQKFRIRLFQIDHHRFLIRSPDIIHIRKRRYQRLCSIRDTGASLNRVFNVFYGNIRPIVEFYPFTQSKGVSLAVFRNGVRLGYRIDIVSLFIRLYQPFINIE